MKKYRLGLLAIALGAVSYCTTASNETFAETQDATAVERNVDAATLFDGTAVVVIANIPSGLETTRKTYVLEDPELILMGNRWLLLGKPLGGPENNIARHATQSLVAWEHVVELSVFTPESFQEFTKQAASSGY